MNAMMQDTAQIKLRRWHAESGFTLVELLVVIGIAVLLMGLIMPSLSKAMRQGERTRVAADLQAIATALEAYKQDHGFYPPVRYSDNLPTGSRWPNPPTGAQILCQALVGPGDMADDGNDGNGFRTRKTIYDARLGGPAGIPNKASGPVYAPYINLDQITVSKETNPLERTLLDRYEKPILYFPANTAKANINGTINGSIPGYIHSDPAANGKESELSYYDADDNLTYFDSDGDGLKRIRMMLGERAVSLNGIVSVDENPVQKPFLLWSAGPDGRFGPDKDLTPPTDEFNDGDADRCDDVTNFRP